MNAVNFLQDDQEAGGANHPLGVALLGIDRSLENTLRFFFSARCRNRFYIEAEGAHADIIIIDLDSSKGKKLWESHSTRNPDRPAILLSLSETSIEGAELVTKPIRVTALQSALDSGRERLRQQAQPPMELEKTRTIEEIPPRPAGIAIAPPEAAPQLKEVKSDSAQIRLPQQKVHKNPSSHSAALRLDEKEVQAFIGSAPDIDAEDPLQLHRAQYDPRNFLVARVMRAFQLAEEKSRPVRLVNGRGSFTLFPEDRQVRVEMQERHLRSLAALPMDDQSFSVSLLAPDSSSDPDAQESLESLDAFVWRMTLGACRGRMPLGTDPLAPVVLEHWPNFSRLQVFPHALRITGLWIRQPHSLLDTAKVLDIPQRYVFAFYSAARALGLATTAPRQPASVPAESKAKPETVQKHGKRNLMVRILQHLGIH